MLKQCVLIVCAALMFVPASTYGLVIGDFEGNMDGWVAGFNGTPVLTLSNTGATSGAQSLALTSSINAFAWSLQWNAPAGFNMSQYKTLSVDVTWVAPEWAPESGIWVQFQLMAINSGGPSGWKQSTCTDSVNAAYPGSWDPNNWGTQTRTLTWDISSYDSTGATWLQIIFATNMGKVTTMGNYYIDNVQLTGAPKIVYVTSVKDQDKNGVQDDLSWVDWLKAQGYDVDARPGNWNDPLDANEIAELNAADLIIASRAMATGDFDGAETPKWNSLSTPIICTNAWMIRNSRWKWMNNNTANKDAGAPLMMVLDANHPIFTGVTLDPDGLVDVLDPNAGSGHTSFLTDFLDPGKGKLLAQSLGKYNTAWIVEWAKGVEYYAGAVEKAGGERLLFMAGTQDDPYTVSATDSNIMPVGVFNLNAAGQQMFLNALAYMLQFKPQDPGKEGLVAAYELENDANDSSGNGLNGTLMGEPNFVEGVTGMAMAFDGVNDYVDCGDEPNYFNITTAITLAAWVLPDISPTKDEPFVQNGDEVGIKIKSNDTLEFYFHGSDLKWYVANIPGATMNEIYGDGQWHHVAGTYDSADNGAGSATLKLYIDGVLKATNTSPSVIPVGTMINLTTHPVNIGRDSKNTTRLFKGAIDDVWIYSRALSVSEVLYLAGR